MQTLVDSSVWIDYFRDGDKASDLDELIDQNTLVTNDLILTELVPFLRLKNQRKIIRLMNSITRFELHIDWEQIAEYQYLCLKKGVNGVGIPDLIIVQNAKQNHCAIYSLDNHFRMISKIIRITTTSTD